MSEPNFYYICKFPVSKYNHRAYFNADQKDLADRWVKHIFEFYNVSGTVKKVVEIEED